MTETILKNGCVVNSWYFLPDYYKDTSGDAFEIQRRCGNMRCINKRHVAYKLVCDKGLEIGREMIHRDKVSPERRAYLKDIKNNPEDLLEDYAALGSCVEVAIKYDLSKSFVSSLIRSLKEKNHEVKS